ncbi:MAG: PIN domain-containing protein [Nanoarchaeota archaeon]
MNLEENYIAISGDEKEDFFFDTYAFFEILKNNENYEKYISAGVVTTKLNLFELYLGVLREVGEQEAENVFDKYYPFVRDFDAEVIKEAAKLKKLINKRNVSMADCIGYVLAKQWGIKFLTGDKEFEDLENVEFVK